MEADSGQSKSGIYCIGEELPKIIGAPERSAGFAIVVSID
jgi:hypothetical protein